MRLLRLSGQHPLQVVAAAVEAFFYRDADDMRTAARMQHFPLRGLTTAAPPVVTMAAHAVGIFAGCCGSSICQPANCHLAKR